MEHKFAFATPHAIHQYRSIVIEDDERNNRSDAQIGFIIKMAFNEVILPEKVMPRFNIPVKFKDPISKKYFGSSHYLAVSQKSNDKSKLVVISVRNSCPEGLVYFKK